MGILVRGHHIAVITLNNNSGIFNLLLNHPRIFYNLLTSPP